ncbi:uncharacterized protein B0H18DRAFT_1084254 [Fomitopsis serialis]|uniref:uncharacterized protein n=1 Tax=Fomitopsis serialis TaxID=139415 RepID=UPI002007A915|nr:uncharacterized protein B0H18DRAFT_1084254 [Neoantrodia serialis]KAH9929198.1 hypothetical protein B0H18DRAFT_1084254 [Neoantrodia serialis]
MSKTRIQPLQLQSRGSDNSRSAYQRQMAVLVIFLVSATVSCFGNASDALPHVPPPTQAVHFDLGLDSDSDSLSSSLSSVLSSSSADKYLAYLPHSGFHNQRIAFENALVLSRLLNRTLLPVYYLPFDQLRDVLANSTKAGLEHCKELRLDGSQEIPPECMDYYDFTYVPWEWLVDLSEIKQEQRLLPCWNLTDTWLEERLNISRNDTFLLKDTARNHYSFLDFSPSPSSSAIALSRKYLESVQISTLALRPERLVFLGTLMGSSRLHLRDAARYQLRARVREKMALTNPLLAALAEDVRSALGGQYLGAHNVRLTWWKLVHTTLGFSIQDTLRWRSSGARYSPRIPLDIPALRVPHPPLPPLSPTTNVSLACPGTPHPSPALTLLNTPLFIATDIAFPRGDPLLARFTRTFPCTFFLADFHAQTAPLDALVSGADGVRLRGFVLPFLDAMIVGRAWAVVGTEQSTYSAFVADVLWRRYHGFEIVQRG